MYFETGELDEFDDWNKCIKNTDVVIHVAARVHKQNNSLMDEQKCMRLIVMRLLNWLKLQSKKELESLYF